MQSINHSLEQLISYIDRSQYRGYDPYDAMNSPLIKAFPGKWPKILSTQILKRLPLNIRPVIGIKKSVNPKMMGLCLQAWCIMYEKYGEQSYKNRADDCFNRLMNNYSKGYHGMCWGYNFPWISPVKYLPAYSPTSVVTAFVVKGLYAYYRVFNSKKALEAILSASRFIMNDLHISRFEEGLCFSYSTLKPELCYNASLLAAEVLFYAWAENGGSKYFDVAKKAVDFVINKQHTDGHWNYSMDLQTNVERCQVDFHQGFILNSLARIIELSAFSEEKYLTALKKGLAFYREKQFTGEGRALWRLPHNWPADIHHQAQGIITFASMGHYQEGIEAFARIIAEWTIANMQDAGGYFYYKKSGLFINKISYLRWGQAWMLLALSKIAQKTT